MNSAKVLFFLMFPVSILARFSFTQTSSSSLQGTVTDPTGGAIAGATVVLLDTGSKLERSMTTAGLGEYRFLALPPGAYALTVNARGFAQYHQTMFSLAR
jgi:Carboxypeptidase regulatory-like domain